MARSGSQLFNTIAFFNLLQKALRWSWLSSDGHMMYVLVRIRNDRVLGRFDLGMSCKSTRISCSRRVSINLREILKKMNEFFTKFTTHLCCAKCISNEHQLDFKNDSDTTSRRHRDWSMH